MNSFPTIKNVTELAIAMGVAADSLDAILSDKRRFYRHVAIPKGKRKTGKHGRRIKSSYPSHLIPQPSKPLRHLDVPQGDLMDIQRWILRAVLYVPPVSDQATAYVLGRNQLANVEPHAHHRFFLCLDICDFFGSIKSNTVADLFRSFGYPAEVSRVLSELCTYVGRLPQGAPSSPAISNLVMRSFDAGAVALCTPRGILYTRYADDMTFSANSRAALTKLLPLADNLLQRNGFKINWRKYHIIGPRRRCEITGLVRDVSSNRFGIGREQKRFTRAVMLSASQKEIGDERCKTMKEIEGWLAYVKGVDGKSHEQMSRYWQRVLAKYGASLKQEVNGQPSPSPSLPQGCPE